MTDAFDKIIVVGSKVLYRTGQPNTKYFVGEVIRLYPNPEGGMVFIKSITGNKTTVYSSNVVLLPLHWG